MQQLDSDLWVTSSPLRFFGVEIGSRMTVIRLPGQKLLLHSPVTATPELVGEVEALGSVAYIVAPNRMHHLSVTGWAKAFPDADVYIAPGLEEKRPDLKNAGVLGDAPEPGWAETVDQVLVEGFPMANEVVFFHRPSATLIVTDIAFNFQASSPAATRFMFRMLQCYGSVRPSLAERLLIRDRPAFRACLRRILAWPFERIVVSHGEISEAGGRGELERGYAWLGEGGEAGPSARG